MKNPTRGGRGTFEVPCTIDIEQTRDSLHAYVDLDGFDVGPGDEVIVHDAPSGIAFGERAILQRRATVRRASVFQRFWAHVEGYLELTELYEVSFSEESFQQAGLAEGRRS
jgi:hypothetical protein